MTINTLVLVLFFWGVGGGGGGALLISYHEKTEMLSLTA